MADIFWDTNLFIYLFEDSPKFGEAVRDLRRSMIRRTDRLITSAMTVGEVLVKPLATNNRDLADRYRNLFSSSAMTVVAFNIEAAEVYGKIRQDRTIHPADAFQLACASAAGVDLFITNDDRLSQKHVEGIQFITSLERAPI
jgi:predicted nucleic acid-binding protein